MTNPEEAHKASRHNREAILDSEYVGCFYCTTNHIDPKTITKWCGGSKAGTAICPECGVDSILPHSPSDKLLKECYNRWFRWTEQSRLGLSLREGAANIGHPEVVRQGHQKWNKKQNGIYCRI